jgi:hypothetical protein
MTDESARLRCQSCDLPKQSLERVESRIATAWKLNLCRECQKDRFEPRFLIILAIRQFGLSPKISEYIKKRRYVGEDIRAVEILQ